MQRTFTSCPARGSLTIRSALSQNNRDNLKINGLVDLLDMKSVKEKRIVQGYTRKSVNVSKSFISNSRIINVTLRLTSYSVVIKEG
jgi:hypothetical protein